MLLTLDKVSKWFGGNQAVAECSFEISERKVTGLVGPNGAGKTTLFNMITGTLPTDEGSISYRSTDITSLSPQKRIELGIARTFQDVRIFPELSVLDNVLVSIQNQLGERLHNVFFRPTAILQEVRANRAFALECLDSVGIQREQVSMMAQDISYAEQKLLSLARLLATGAELLLLDEPASGLDEASIDILKNILRTIIDEGKTVLIVEHNMLLVRELSDWIVFLDGGRVLAEDTPSKIMQNKDLQTVYFGVQGTS